MQVEQEEEEEEEETGATSVFPSKNRNGCQTVR
jgi:hypothetical protein